MLQSRAGEELAERLVALLPEQAGQMCGRDAENGGHPRSGYLVAAVFTHVIPDCQERLLALPSDGGRLCKCLATHNPEECPEEVCPDRRGRVIA